MIERAISVSQLGNYIRQIFDAEELLHHIRVVGEISGLSISRGVAYFNMKDENALFPCVSFSSDVISELKEGSQMLLTGSPSYYLKGGRLNFNVEKVEALGLGELYEKFLKLKEKLEKEGLFDIKHKKPLPKSIKRIGVITSREGAVIEDIKTITRRRDANTDIIIFSVKVQGIGSELEISKAIDKMSNYKKIDVLIVARGGGSLEDLSAFNTEVVARSAYNCSVPLISAIGHETDFTILDFVADFRAPTPSAAAELVTEDIIGKKEKVLNLIEDFKFAMKDFANKKNENVELFKQKASLFRNLDLNVYQNKSSKFFSYLSNLYTRMINDTMFEVNDLTTSLKRFDPNEYLKLGYCKIENNGRVVKSIKDLSTEDKIQIYLNGGQAEAEILEVKNDI